MDKIKIQRGFTKDQRTILCDARILSGKLLGEQGADRRIPYGLLEAIFRVRLSEERTYGGTIRELTGWGFLRQTDEPGILIVTNRVECTDPNALLGEKLGVPPAHRWMENLIAHWKKDVRIFFSCHAMWAPDGRPGLHTDEPTTVRRLPYRQCPATGRPSGTTVSDT